MITINECELAVRLAHRQVEYNLLEEQIYNGYDHDNDCGAYTEEAQIIFDKYYDDYYTIIMELAETQYSKELPFTTESLLSEIKKVNDDYKAKLGL